jgi:hypothetical protein
MKKSKIVTSIPLNLVIYHTKNLCHHIEHILFYLLFKYGEFKQILLLVESFSIKLCGTQFLSHLLEHLRTLMCFNHPHHKKSPPF